MLLEGEGAPGPSPQGLDGGGSGAEVQAAPPTRSSSESKLTMTNRTSTRSPRTPPRFGRSEEPSGSAGGGRSRSPVADLPDLTEHLQSLGLYEEYQRFKDGYMKWRQGAAQGARGEASADAFEERQQRDFEDWCPTFRVWKWRRTISYWVTVTFFEGSLLFTISSLIGCLPMAKEHKVGRALIVWPYFIGGCFFQLGAYFMCLEIVNLRNHGPADFWPFARKETLARLAAVKVSKNPYFSAMSFFFGCMLYNIPLLIELGGVELPEDMAVILMKIPYTIAGGLFMLGGLFEAIENEIFTSKPDSMSKWSAISNVTGGLLFLLAAVADFWSGWWCSFLWFVGSVLYTGGSILGLFLWRDEQFGLAFLVALNTAARKSRASRSGGSRPREHGQEQTFSYRSIFFILFYCVVAVLVVYNTGLVVQFVPEQCAGSASEVYNEVLPFFLMHMVLLMHSAVVQTPSRQNQPFHMLVMTTRVLSITTGINAICTFASWMPRIVPAPPPPPPVPGPEQSLGLAYSTFLA
jgi:hypothetical protein